MVSSPLSPCLSRMLRTLSLLTFLLLIAGHAGAQEYVGRYDIYSGFTTLETPYRDLVQRGYHLQLGYNARTWASLGFDYSVSSGHNTITPNFLPLNLQQLLRQELGPAYALVAVPADDTTQTFAAGPQYQYRRFDRATLFVRPALGAVRESATPHPKDPLNTAIVRQLVPSGHKTDWQGFYGFGGGLDLNATKHISLRMQTDVVYYHLFNDILRDGSWTVRWSAGPSFHFGRNVRAENSVQPKSASTGPLSQSSHSNP
ncbi:MAG: hypothetical protein JWM54_1067 [Acidobacteriaceae bacterium]|nr:hypothetical protein [Acidobacteriaceae bacterium]